MLSNALPADSFYKVYPGIYLGGGLPAQDYIEDKTFLDIVTLGVDIQAGFQLDLLGLISLGAYANVGFDSGLPNQPNFYYGAIGELLLGGELLKYGIALGGGYNTSVDTSLNNQESFYLRVALPVVFFGLLKTSLCYDLYPDIGSRLGLLVHLNSGIGF